MNHSFGPSTASFLSRSKPTLSSAIFDLSDIPSHVQQHLLHVYSLLAVGLLSAAGGAYLESTLMITVPPFLSVITLFASLTYLLFSRGVPSPTRIAVYLLFAVVKGIALGPLLRQVAVIDPSIISAACTCTAGIFLCFSGGALYTSRRTFLFVGGILSSALTAMAMLSMLGMFISLPFVYALRIYGGLILFSLYIVYDTQLIIEKSNQGSVDYVTHALELFMDLVNVFVRVLIIMAKNKKSKSKRKKN
eukprot:gb/GECH01011715.1/.p1 GENE.gb/GECH01011715.1/~~gb/GECH01011715.1/.p1  ORF type:complete len:248 (+),score=43.42 gb/GECH01011715.1/:1-744(+)